VWCDVLFLKIVVFEGENEKLPLFAVGVLLLYIGFPVACVGATSLLTKCVSLRVQGAAATKTLS